MDETNWMGWRNQQLNSNYQKQFICTIFHYKTRQSLCMIIFYFHSHSLSQQDIIRWFLHLSPHPDPHTHPLPPYSSCSFSSSVFQQSICVFISSVLSNIFYYYYYYSNPHKSKVWQQYFLLHSCLGHALVSFYPIVVSVQCYFCFSIIVTLITHIVD